MTDNKIIFFLTKLANTDRREEYEAWVREVDIPAVMAWPCTSDYRVVRLDEAPVLENIETPGYDYIEIMEVSSLDDYRTDVAGSPPELFDGLMSHIGPIEAAIGSVVR